MSYVKLLRQSTGLRSTIVIGLLLSGVLALGAIYMYQNHNKIGPDSVPVGRWNAEQVLIEFNQFMGVLEQHERVVALLPQDWALTRKMEIMSPIGAELKKQFTILMAEVEKADNFNSQYPAYVFKELPEYPNVHKNLLGELRALQPTIFGLAEAERLFSGRRSIYRDLNIRLKPFVQKLNVVAVVASQRELEQEKARTDRILELSRYLLIVTILLLLGGIWFLVLFVGRNQAKRKIAQLEHEINLEAIEQLPVGIAFYDSDNKLVRTNRCYRELYQLPEHLVRTGTPLEAVIRHWAGMKIYGEV